MRFTAFFGILAGVLLGTLVGAAGAFLLSIAVSGGNSFAAGFTLLFAGPIGIIGGIVIGVGIARRVLRRENSDNSDRKQKAVRVIGLLAGAPGLAAGMLGLAFFLMSPPSDRQLMANFERNPTTFDRLACMVQADRGLTRVDETWTAAEPPERTVSPARLREYRRLLQNVQTPRGFQATPQADEIQFFYWITGSAVSSDTMKGYAYLSKPPPPVKLRNCLDDPQGTTPLYRHIRGKWYLFYRYIPG